jgi:hypothetical protein
MARYLDRPFQGRNTLGLPSLARARNTCYLRQSETRPARDKPLLRPQPEIQRPGSSPLVVLCGALLCVKPHATNIVLVLDNSKPIWLCAAVIDREVCQDHCPILMKRTRDGHKIYGLRQQRCLIVARAAKDCELSYRTTRHHAPSARHACRRERISH